MLFPSGTSLLRKICQDIEEEFTQILTFNDMTRKIADMISNAAHPHGSYSHPLQSNVKDEKCSSSTSLASNDDKKKIEKVNKMFETVKHQMVKCISNKLPLLINYEERNANAYEDLKEDYGNLEIKYKQMVDNYQSKQLQNDKIKMEIYSLSETYETLVISYQQLKYKHQQQSDKCKELQLHNKSKQSLQNSKPESVGSAIAPRVQHLNKSVMANSIQQSSRIQTQSKQYYQQIMREYQQTVRESEKEIEALKRQIIEEREYIGRLQQENSAMAEENARLEQQNRELKDQNRELKDQNREMELISAGEKSRSQKLDRQILQLLNKNQDYKLQILQNRAELQGMHNKYNQCMDALTKKEDIIIKQGEKCTQNDLVIEELLKEKKHLVSENSSKINELLQIKTQLEKVKQQLARADEMRNGLMREIQKLNQIIKSMKVGYQESISKMKAKYMQDEEVLKGKNAEKIGEISKMHDSIQGKLSVKIQLLEKFNKQCKEKNKTLKQQIQRLYQSLQIQVEKEHKYQCKLKHVIEKQSQDQHQLSELKYQHQRTISENELLQSTVQQLKKQLIVSDKKLKHFQHIKQRILKELLPNISSEIMSLKLGRQHLIAMMKMEGQQLGFLQRKQCQSIKMLIFQKQQQNISNNSIEYSTVKKQLQKWKQNCKIYQTKYQQLQLTNSKLKNQAIEYERECYGMRQAIQKHKINEITTNKSMQTLREKCKEVESFYKLIEDLSKENQHLKSKLQQFQYKLDQYQYLPQSDHLPSFTKKEGLSDNHTHPHIHNHKYVNSNATTAMKRSQQCRTTEDQMATRAEIQRLRFQGIKRQYQMLHRQQI